MARARAHDTLGRVIDDAFRRILPGYTQRLIAIYRALDLSPNTISVLGCAIGVVAAVCVARDWGLLAIGVWWLGRLLDGTDGIYARATGRATPFGAYLDICLDMLAYGIMIVGFAFAHPEWQTHWLLIELLYVLCITSALALGSQEAQLDIPPRDERGLRLGAGLAEGGETGIAYTLFLLFPGQLGWLTTIWIGVLITTVVARTILARRLLG
jgi:phosphatidylglycerophosphate synthase